MTATAHMRKRVRPLLYACLSCPSPKWYLLH